jgi:hypothetical protein
MTKVSERKLAEEFDQALNHAAASRTAVVPGPRPAPTAESAESTAALTAMALRIGQVTNSLPGIDETFRAELRERLVRLAPEYAAATPAPASGSKRHHGGRHAGAAGRQSSREGSRRGLGGTFSSPWRRRLLAAGVGMAVATGSVGGIAIASSDAVPGDPLYNAKKLFENIQLSLSGSPTDRGEQYLRLAETRLNEIDTLMQRPDADIPDSATAGYLTESLNELNTSIGDGGSLLIGQVQADDDQGALNALSDFLLTERQRVADLEWQLPTALQGQAAQIVTLMDGLYNQLQQAAAAAPSQSGPTNQGSAGSGESGAGQSHAPGTGGAQAGASGTGATTQPTNPTHASGTGGSASPGAATASPSPSTTIGINLPLPILPSTGLDVPPLLGLPGIDIGLGGGSDTGSASPSPNE